MTTKTKMSTEETEVVSKEAVSMILVGIMTFLVIVLSYRYIQSQIGQRRRKTKAQPNKPKTKTKGNTTKLQEDDDEDSSTIDDVLVKASDIKPLDDDALERMAKENAPPPTPEIADDTQKHPKAKDLEEEVAKSLTQEQLEEEAKVRQDQLSAIFKLMEDNKERFGFDNMTEVQEQYKLYK